MNRRSATQPVVAPARRPAADDAVRWVGPAPDPGEHVLVVAPHPDDEIIAAAGLLLWLGQLGVRVSLVAVTDGERSHARSKLVTPDELRARRALERTAALAVLGVVMPVERLGLPDGSVARNEDQLTAQLLERSATSTTIIAPWAHDGHVDHDAVGRAAVATARRGGAALWEVPIWAKVRAPSSFSQARSGSTSRLVLSEALQKRKQEAFSCHLSQLRPLGPSPLDGPVVRPHEFAAFVADGEELAWR